MYIKAERASQEGGRDRCCDGARRMVQTRRAEQTRVWIWPPQPPPWPEGRNFFNFFFSRSPRAPPPRGRCHRVACRGNAVRRRRILLLLLLLPIDAFTYCVCSVKRRYSRTRCTYTCVFCINIALRPPEYMHIAQTLQCITYDWITCSVLHNNIIRNATL